MREQEKWSFPKRRLFWKRRSLGESYLTTAWTTVWAITWISFLVPRHELGGQRTIFPPKFFPKKRICVFPVNHIPFIPFILLREQHKRILFRSFPKPYRSPKHDYRLLPSTSGIVPKNSPSVRSKLLTICFNTRNVTHTVFWVKLLNRSWDEFG